MKILIAMKADAELRSLDGIVSELLDRGHDVDLVFQSIKTDNAQAALGRFAEGRDCLTVRRLPRGRRTPRGALAEDLRRTADYLHYLDPAYAKAPKLRDRRARNAPATARFLGRAARPFGTPGRKLLRNAARGLDRRLEPAEELVEVLRRSAPDVLLTTTLVSVGLPHADLVRAARLLGIKTSYLVFSWDNLTNKGLIREVPDEVLVWNDLQAREAVELHDIPAGRVRVTGAPSYDHWFDWQPSRPREDFAAVVGLDPSLPYVLYTCSTDFIARDEVSFVRRWLAALRASTGPAAGAGVLVRPHPFCFHQWQGVDLGDPNVVIWPPAGEEPIEQRARENYFDSIHHSAAVVGINTSAQIEAAIVDRPVHTILADEFRQTQEGTLHFHYLTDEGFGHVHVARSLDEHVAQLEASLRGETDPEPNRRFVQRFVRPLGLDVSATSAVVDAVEELGRRPTPPSSPRILSDAQVRYLSSLAWRRRRVTRRRAKAARSAMGPIGSPGSNVPPR